MQSKILLVTLALAAAAPFDAAAQVASQPVRYGDLDLTGDRGQHTLQVRLAAAIRQVCGDPAEADLRATIERKRCQQSAWANASRAAKSAVDAGRNGLARADRVSVPDRAR